MVKERVGLTHFFHKKEYPYNKFASRWHHITIVSNINYSFYFIHHNKQHHVVDKTQRFSLIYADAYAIMDQKTRDGDASYNIKFYFLLSNQKW